MNTVKIKTKECDLRTKQTLVQASKQWFDNLFEEI